MQKHVTDYALYRWRYAIGYLGVFAIIGLVFYIAAMHVPGSLRQGEIESSIRSGLLSIESLDPEMIIDLPYHIIQRLSFNVFGVTTFSIKLPSIILGIATTIGMYFLIQSWFRRNVAILATILTATTTQLIFITQDGTPSVMFAAISVWLLYATTRIARHQLFATFWRVIAGALIAMSLYMPLGIYLVIALVATAIYHPHVRYVLRTSSWQRLAIAITCGIIAILPIIYVGIIKPSVVGQLVGIPPQIELTENFTRVVKDLFGYTMKSEGHLLRPLYSLGATLLAAIGVYRLLTHHYTARSMVVIIWAILLFPVIIINPDHITSLTLIASLMMTLGIATLIANWYKLFPRNPYARVTGLIPLSIIVIAISISGVLRYANNYQQNPEVLSYYNSDLSMLQQTLAKTSTQKPTTLVASADELPFYNLVAHYDDRFSAIAAAPGTPSAIATREGRRAHMIGKEPTTIITNRMAQHADRLYVYAPSQ